MLGRYQILKPLAKGGMAEVFLARTIGIKGFERHVVLKFIRVEHGANPQTVEMLLDEARLVAALHHRNIVQVHDVGQAEGQYFFAMEYVHGEDARALLRKVKDTKTQLPFAHILTIVSAAAAGLHYAHEMRGPDRKPLNIVHRDISPGNILLGFDGGVKVVDFGIAKTDRQEENTRAGELKGKVGYMSPEQCKALPLDRRTDIYMLGIVLYELCTVRRLFKGENRFQTMQQIVEGNIAPPSRYRKDIPDELEQIIMKALATDPADRYQTADDLRLVLEAFATRANFQISPSKLSDYLKDLFGERLEPWLVDAPPPDAEVPETAEQDAAMVAEQLAAEAEAKKVRNSTAAIKKLEPDPEPTSSKNALDPAADDTPMAWGVDIAKARRKRNMLFGVIAAVALAGGLAAFLMTRGSTDSTTNAATTPPPPATPIENNTAALAIDAGVATTPDDAAMTADNTPPVTGGSAVDENDIVITNGSGTAVAGAGSGSQSKPTPPRPPRGGVRPPRPRPGKGEGSGVKIEKPPGGGDLDAPMPD